MWKWLWIKLKERQTKSNLVPSIIAGVIGGIIKIVAAMAFSALIFTGTLAAYLPQGIGIVLFGFFLFAVISIFTASYPVNINTPQDIQLLLLLS